MSSVALSGNASGTGVFTVASPNSNNSYTATLPAATTTLVGTDATQTLTNKTLTSPTITGAVVSSMASSVITSGTAVASTSGTSIDFTGIPSWVKRITVMFNGVSTNGTSLVQVQAGTSSGATTSGYTGGCQSSGASNANSTGFIVDTSGAATNTRYGSLVLLNISGNNWVASGDIYLVSIAVASCGGSIALSGTLDRVRITTVNGTDTFDAGTINILYE